MQTYVVLLRGINVGGGNIVKMAALREQLTDAGFAKVATYIQSGNIVLQSAETADDVSTTVTSVLKSGFGVSVPVLVLDAAFLRDVYSANPMPIDTPKALHVFFLSSTPKLDETLIAPLKTPTERIKITDTHAYFYAPDGFGRSKLASKFEKALGTPATARNFATVTKLVEMVDQV